MNADQCKSVIENLEIVRHVAAGGRVQYALCDYRGTFIRWGNPTNRVLLGCLGGYRIVPNPKPRVRIHACGSGTYMVPAP
jgi:hypothetical protein